MISNDFSDGLPQLDEEGNSLWMNADCMIELLHISDIYGKIPFYYILHEDENNSATPLEVQCSPCHGDGRMTIMELLPFFNDKSFIIKYYGLHFSVVKLRWSPSKEQLGNQLQLIFDAYLKAVKCFKVKMIWMYLIPSTMNASTFLGYCIRICDQIYDRSYE